MRTAHILAVWSAFAGAASLAACGPTASPQGPTPDGGLTDGGGEQPDATLPPGDAAVDAFVDAPADAGPPAHFPFPPVVNQGGAVLPAPRVVTVTFPADPLATDLAQFGASLASSAYWDTVRAGYCVGSACVGDGPAGAAVALATPPDASYTDGPTGTASTLKTYLSGLVTGGQLPAPDASTIYVLYFPKSTAITFGGAQSCTDFHAYHQHVTVNGQRVIYAVVPECDPAAQTPPATLLQALTSTASHEIIEAATDPGGGAGIGFYLDGTAQEARGWGDILGGEVADLCVDAFALGQGHTTEGPYTVARVWSIPNATAGKNPCVPVPAGEVYFDAVPSANAVVLDVGQSKTIDVTAMADGPIPAWTVTAEDWTDPATRYLAFAIAGAQATDAGPAVVVKNGDKLSLTVTLLADPGASSAGEADAVLVSADGTGATVTRAHFWPFVVLTPAEAADAGVTGMSRRRPRPRAIRGRPAASDGKGAR